MIVATRTEPSVKRRSWNFWGHSSETTRHYYNVTLAIVVFFIAQLLTCVWDLPFWATGLDFPGQIAAMIFVWIVMWACQVLFFKSGEGLEWFYHRYLRNPTGILNKHMSIGFTVPFLNLIRQSFPGTEQIGLLTAAFVVTGILNSIFVYLIAYHVQFTVSKLTSRKRPNNFFDVESPAPQIASHMLEPRPSADSQRDTDGVESVYNNRDKVNENEASRLARFRKHISDASTLCSITGDEVDPNGEKQACTDERRGMRAPDSMQERIDSDIEQSSYDLGPTQSSGASSLASQLSKVPRAIHSWMAHNIFLSLSILLFLVVGLPISFVWNNDLFLDVGFLFTVWLTFTSAQTCTKQHISEGSYQHRRTVTAIATLLNPVLWTSLFLVAYGLAKSGIRNQPPSGIAATFTTKNTISDIMGHHIKPSNFAAPSPSHIGNIPIGAGDIATSILNAGIVSWGLRLFEYRRQVISRGGVTVIITSLVASLFNVVAWPLLANKMGVRPASSDLSFAARSVTIALGGPAMESLGGDTGVNAVGVVVNGICFQLVAGLLVGGVDFDGIMGVWRKCNDSLLHDGLVWNGIWTTKGSGGSDATKSKSHPDTEKGQSPATLEGIRQHNDRDDNEEARYSSDTTHVDDQGVPSPSPRAPAYEGQDVPLPPISMNYCNINDTCSNVSEGNGRSRSEEGNEEAAARKPDDIRTVAAGVTIGINAAAMGTVHLYEQNSHAAPYSALSMTTFGVFTVLFAVRSPLTEWLVVMVGGG